MRAAATGDTGGGRNRRLPGPQPEGRPVPAHLPAHLLHGLIHGAGPQTRRNLELFEGGRWGDPRTSLLSVLDRTHTSMGGRLLRRWLGQPLLEVGDIVRRQDAVTWFHRSALRRGRVSELLDSVSDLERLINRVRGHTATPRDLVALGQSLRAAPEVRAILKEDEDAPQVGWLAEGIGDNHEVVELIANAIADDPPPSVGDGRVVREGFSSDLDALRNSSRNAQEYIAGLERKERERTGIKSLKVGYNKVFGYYIEVSKSNLSHVPEEYIRRQTLVGGERYITPEMKEYESLVLNAQERVGELEAALFRQVCQQLGEAAPSIMATADAIAQVDVFYALGEVASRHGYVRPRSAMERRWTSSRGAIRSWSARWPQGPSSPTTCCCPTGTNS